MATLKIATVAGPLSPLNPGNFQWHSDGVVVTLVRPTGKIQSVLLNDETALQVIESAFAEHGVPLSPHVGGPIVGGLWSRMKKAATKAANKTGAGGVVRSAVRVVPKDVRQAATKAATRLESVAKQAADVYSSPMTATVLGAVSAAVPVAAPVTAPLAAGSAFTPLRAAAA